MTTWFAPGRANLMGEHTDYNDGLVLPFALAQGITATATTRSDGMLVLRSKQMPGGSVSAAVMSLEPGSVRGWAAYPAGVAWALREAGYPVPSADIYIDSDLPVGAGVSSSAALECSVALAVCDLGGFTVERRELAAIARRAENDFVGAPTGMIDQSAALLCRPGHVMLLDCGTREIRHVPFHPAEDGIVALVIDTRVTHALVSGEYAARRAECEEAARLLGAGSLGSLIAGEGVRVLADEPTGSARRSRADALLSGLADPVLRRRARHVITDSARAAAIAGLLDAAAQPDIVPDGAATLSGAHTAADGHTAASASAVSGASTAPGAAPCPTAVIALAPAADMYQAIGELFTEAHASLRDDLEVSWTRADVTVEVAVAAGAFGAKMIGGGFGGSVLALVPLSALAAVRTAVTREFASRSWESPGFLDAVPSAAAHRLA